MLETFCDLPVGEVSVLPYVAQQTQKDLIFFGKNRLFDGSTP
jgi:hypothetical protein